MIDEYKEIVEIIQQCSEEQGLSYAEGLKKAKEKLLSDRAVTHKSNSNFAKKIQLNYSTKVRR